MVVALLSRLCDNDDDQLPRENIKAEDVKDASVLLLLPEAKEGPKLPFGGGGN